MTVRFFASCFAVVVALILIGPTRAIAQSRDYITDEEAEIVRDAQEIDKRISVLVHCIDRRLTALKLAADGRPEKTKDDWGPMPSGTRVELLSDIKNLLQKAIDDIDNLAEHPDSAYIPLDPKEKRKKAPDIFSAAVRSLAAAAARYRPIFNKELDNSKDQKETGLLTASIEMCDEITASVTKLGS
jgi:hypothetical protein